MSIMRVESECDESMARVQPVLSATELALVDQMAELTHSKRTDVIKSALGVYHWFVRQALTGGRVIARKPTGEEVAFETAELSALEGKGNRLSPEELGLLVTGSSDFHGTHKTSRLGDNITAVGDYEALVGRATGCEVL